MTVSVFIATSLDGFVARADGSLDWLAENGGGAESEDYGYTIFVETVDVLVMGRKTFEKVLTFDAWPYEDKRVIVLSSSGVDVPQALRPRVTVEAAAPPDLVRRLSGEGVRHLYVDGADTIQRFLRAGLITEMIITTVPVLLGQGIPLFGPLQDDVWLKHMQTKDFQTGFVQSRYRLGRRQPGGS